MSRPGLTKKTTAFRLSTQANKFAPSMEPRKIISRIHGSYDPRSAPSIKIEPRWRNWQTRNVEVVVGATPCWFNSSPGHSLKNPMKTGFFARNNSGDNCTNRKFMAPATVPRFLT